MTAPRTLICGSLALDTIMVFPDRFSRHILPAQTHVLSVSFQIGEMRREWGGCAGNIAYNLKALGGEPVAMATIGGDDRIYPERLSELGIRSEGVRAVDGTYTAQAFIITDLDDNQITAFHPGAMTHAHLNRIADAPSARLGIVSPDGRQGMVEHVADFAAAGIPYIFDPGQGLPMFSGAELLGMVKGAACLASVIRESTAKSDPTETTSASPTAACSNGSRGGEPPATGATRSSCAGRMYIARTTPR